MTLTHCIQGFARRKPVILLLDPAGGMSHSHLPRPDSPVPAFLGPFQPTIILHGGFINVSGSKYANRHPMGRLRFQVLQWC